MSTNEIKVALRPSFRAWGVRIKTTIIAAAISVGSVGGVYADDTEVFFGQVDPTQNSQPNVMFVLDTSGSMGWFDGQSLSRLDRMKNAMRDILNQSTNINVGLMRFNGSGGGGSVLYPITSLNENVCANNDCGEIHLNVAINSPDDDIEENANGAMDFNGQILSLSQNSVPGAEKKIGLRFSSLNVPQGATITSASITVTAQSDDGSPGLDAITIRAEQAKNSAPYETNNSNASSRPHGSLTTWMPGPWVAGQQFKTSDLTTQVQEIVNRGDWCGGNAISFLMTGAASRDIVSYNNGTQADSVASGEAPILNVSYDTSSIQSGGGCATKFLASQVISSSDDAEEFSFAYPARTSTDLDLFSEFRYQNQGRYPYQVGIRFRDINIPKNSVIVDARIEFTMRANSIGSGHSARIYGEWNDDPNQFSYSYRNIDKRIKTNANVLWENLPARSAGDKLITGDLSPIVEEITRLNGWDSGNSMVFLIDPLAAGGVHSVQSYNGNPASAPKLLIQYQSVVQPTTEPPSYITARDLLLTELDNMDTSGGTPIVGAYHEAAQYFLGGGVDYGTHRGLGASNRRHRVSHPLSYAGGQVFRHSDCTDSDILNSDCISETINGNARYISPMESSCQTNHIVLLSDGQATNSGDAVSRVQNTISSNCDHQSNAGETCGTELAHWLATNDHSPQIRNEQKIKTYTIGFAADLPFLERIASHGEGRYFQASSSAQLVSSFEDILDDVYSVDTSFVAPGATVNQFNRLTHRNDIYFAVFKPEERPTWSGNLKKYEVGLTADGDPAVFDYSTPRKQAIDPTTGFFADNAISGWSSETDGSNVPEGGAAEQLSSLTTRNIYTFLGDVPAGGVDLIANGTPLRETEAEITNAHLGLTGANQNVNGQAINRDNLLKWARGVDVKDSNNNGDSSETRSHMGDPMHSRPVIVNYAKNQTESYTTIFVGTNEGVLHGFDSETGEELFAYMPEDLLPNIQKNFTDATSTSHPYGFDGPISIWTIDSNNNVVIDSNETAMLFIGMRRGGSNYYAFDIADRRNPVLKWVIKGGVNGDAGFGQLGQSWSTMEPTKIRLNNQERDVLIFGGGYDTGNDVDHTIGAVAKTVDTIGRGIFIVDALTGEMLYQLGHNSDNEASQQFEDMKFAFPGGIRVMDFDGNGFADTLFAGDMGGQVWRFDLDLYHASGNLVIGDGKNVMANLGGSNAGLSGNLIGNLPNSRRFFDEPDVALIREDGERFISISVGSGWRSHPLNTDVNDRIYSMRSYDIFTLPDGYGKETSPGSGVYTPITENDLTDVTNDLNPDVGDYGWRMSFNEPGEKVAGQVQTANSALVFTTYQPETNVASCSTALGSGAVWAVRVSDGRPALDLNEDGIWDVSDRSQDLTQSGLPPEASILILEGDVTTASSSSTNNSNSGSGSDSSSGGTGTGTGQSSSGGEQTTTSTEIKTAVFVAGESVFEKLFKGSLTRRESWIDAGMRSTGAEGASIDPQTAVTDPSATSADPSQAQTAETSTD